MKKNLLFKLSALLLLLCGTGDMVWMIGKSSSIPGLHIQIHTSFFTYCVFLVFSGLVKMLAGAVAVVPRTASGSISWILGIASVLFGTLEAIAFYNHSILLNATLLVSGICASLPLIILHPINLPRRDHILRLSIGILLILSGCFTIVCVAMHFHFITSCYVYIPVTHPLSLMMQRLSRVALFRAFPQLITGIAALLPVRSTKGIYYRCTAALLNIIINISLPWDQFGLKSICIWLPLSVAVSAIYLFTQLLFSRQKEYPSR